MAVSRWNKETLYRLVREKLGGSRFIVVSNREPYIHVMSGEGITCTRPVSGLTEALDPVMRASGGIWVAQGTYYSGTARSASFHLKHGVAVYGGFSGVETGRDQRDPSVHPTILSGEIGAPGTVTDNCYHVVTGSGTDSTAVLDGFTVTGGYALESFPNNLGGGMFNLSGSPTVSNVIFKDNTAWGGGGMCNIVSWASVTNAVFLSNSSMVENGGAIYNVSSAPVITNATFAKNSSPSAGAAILNNHSDPALTNVIVWGNTPASGQIDNINSVAVIGHSLIQGSGGSGAGWDASFGADIGGNLDSDPLFVDLSSGDLHLGQWSPAIDSGDDLAPNLPQTDLDGNPRIVGAAADMGAYEYAVATGADVTELPSARRLYPPYPNPFNPAVTIAFELDRSRHVRVSVFNVLGQRVRLLLNETRHAGMQTTEWDGRDDHGNPVSSGVYMVRVEIGAWKDQRKITLLK